MTPASTTLAAPALTHFLDLDVQVGAPVDVGRTAAGQRRVIPITGGQARARDWTARVLPGGADFQAIATDTLARLEARYVLETEAGERIYVVNHAIRSGPADLIAKLVRGEPVDPALIYFRCVPSFETAAPSLQWITERIFLGTGARHPDRVCLSVYDVA